MADRTTNVSNPQKRALLIGATANDLSGIEHDVREVTACLDRLGFACTTCVGEQATRDNILTALTELCASTNSGDTVCIYYSGHGGLALNPNAGKMYRGRREPETYQYLVPVDHRRSDRFRGIFRAELSALIGALSQRTPNITVILDCCHASGMVRDTGYTAKALRAPAKIGVGEHVAWLRERGYDLTSLCPEGNPDVVQLVACQASQTAYEFTDAAGRRHGLLTAMWLRVMAEVHANTTWSSLGARVRELVQQQLPAQRPGVSGPATRVVFGIERRHTPGVLAFARDGDSPVLRGGSLHGVAIGDRYLVMPLEAGTGSRDVALAEAVVTKACSHFAEVSLQPPEANIPVGTRAFLAQRRHVRYPVAYTGATLPGTPLRDALANSPLLQLVGATGRKPFVTVERRGQHWHITDLDGQLVFHPLKVGSTEISQVVSAIERVARAEALRLFQSGVGRQQLDPPPRVTWGVVGGATYADTIELPVVKVGDRLVVRVDNPGGVSVYTSVLGIGVDASISLLSRATPQGREVFCGQPYVLGEDALGDCEGVPIAWSREVPNDGRRRAALVVVTSDLHVDLRPLTTGPWPHAARCAYAASEVLPPPKPAMRSARAGGPGRSARYAVRVFQFWVEP